MKQRLLARRPSPAMVVAVVALVSSLTGGAVAATLITGKDIAKNAIAKKHIKKNAVVSKKVKDGSLLAEDFKPGQLVAGAPGATGPQGPKGDQGEACLPTNPLCVGPKGDKGDPGTNGVNGAPGAVGPTAGYMKLCGPCIAPDGDTTVDTATFNLPTSGKLWLTAPIQMAFTCGAGACGLYYTLKVDGDTVPNGLATVSGVASQTKYESTTVVGVTGTLAAGDHTIALRRGTNFGTPSTVSDQFFSIGGILLGG